MPPPFLILMWKKHQERDSEMGARRIETCIVNDVHGSQGDVCGRPADEDQEFSGPACIDHLCQHVSSSGHRCKKMPERLDKGTIRANGGWFPDLSRSANCRRHEKYNCAQLINNSVRCSGTKVSGLDYCASHAALMCKWEEPGERDECGGLAYPGSKYCPAHCCKVEYPDGHRCPERRNHTSPYCSGHRCGWKNLVQQRCAETWYPSNTVACEKHKCVDEGCDQRAENNTIRCEDHLCAFRYPHLEESLHPDFPVCYRERPAEGTLCELHAEYMELFNRVDDDKRKGAGYWPTPPPEGGS